MMTSTGMSLPYSSESPSSSEKPGSVWASAWVCLMAVCL
jgi:hypothetical protein